jgi:predicted ArsR family transcriptional regulator
MKDLTELHDLSEKVLTAASELHNEVVVSERDITYNQKGERLYGRLKDLTEILAAAATDVEEHLNYMEDEADAKWKEDWAANHRPSLFWTATDIGRSAMRAMEAAEARGEGDR